MINKVSNLINLPEDPVKRSIVIKSAAITLIVVGILLILVGSLSLGVIEGSISPIFFLHALNSLGTKAAVSMVVLGSVSLCVGIVFSGTKSSTMLTQEQVKKLSTKLNKNEYFIFTTPDGEKGISLKFLSGLQCTRIGPRASLLIQSLKINDDEQCKEVSLANLQKRQG